MIIKNYECALCTRVGFRAKGLCCRDGDEGGDGVRQTWHREREGVREGGGKFFVQDRSNLRVRVSIR